MKEIVCLVLSIILAMMTFLPNTALAMEETNSPWERETPRAPVVNRRSKASAAGTELKVKERAWVSKELVRQNEEYFRSLDAQQREELVNWMSSELDDSYKFVKSLKSITEYIGTISMMICTLENAWSLLERFGIIKNDEGPTTVDLVYETTQRIEEAVGQINNKLDGIAVSMADYHTDEMMEHRRTQYYNNKGFWEEFIKTVQALRAKKSELGNATSSYLNQYAASWQKSPATSLRLLYGYVNEEGKAPQPGESRKLILLVADNNMPLPGTANGKCPTKSKDGIPVAYSVVIPGSQLNRYIDKNTAVTVKNFKQLLEDTITKSVKNSGVVEFISDQGDTIGWSTMTQQQREEYAAKLVKDAQDALSFAATYYALENNNGKLYSEIVSAYNDFADRVIGNEYLVTPMEAYHNMLTLTHAFEGEVIADEYDVYNYLVWLNQAYGSLVMTVAGFSSLAGEKDLNALRDTYWECGNALLRSHSDFITGNDNYCYLMKAPIEYRSVSLKSTLSLHPTLETLDEKGRMRDMHYDYEYSYHSEDFSSTPWTLYDNTKVYPAETDGIYQETVEANQAEILKNLVGSADVMLLYKVYASLYNNGTVNMGSFYKYLRAYGAYVPENVDIADADRNYGMPNTLVTAFNYTKDKTTGEFAGLGRTLNLGDRISMKAWNVHKLLWPNCWHDNYTFKHLAQYAISDGKGRGEKFVVHDQVAGDLFYPDNGSLASDRNLAARALYGDDQSVYFFTDSKEADVSVKIGKSEYDHNRSMYLTEFTFSLPVSQPVAVLVKCAGSPEPDIKGNYRVKEGVTSLSSWGLAYSGMFGIERLELPATLPGSAIHSDAFFGLGSEDKPVLLRYNGENKPSSDMLLSGKWKGGWFGNARIKLDVGYGGEEKLLYKTVVEGDDVAGKKFSLEPEGWPNGRILVGWATRKGATTAENSIIAKDGMTLYAVWAFDHEHQVKIVVNNPTCVKDGLIGRIYCTICGLVMNEGDFAPALGHDFGITEQDLLTANAGAEHKFTKTCARCGEKHTFEKFTRAVSIPYDIYYDATEEKSVTNVLSIDDKGIIIRTGATVAIRNKEKNTAAAVPFWVAKDLMGNLVLCGVNIDTHTTAKPAITTESGSTGIHVVLAEGSVNSLYSGSQSKGQAFEPNEVFAGLNATKDAMLRISGSGKLTAQSRMGAGIGGNGANITIEGGDITAIGYGGAGIGANWHSDIGNITINGGTVNASVKYARLTGYSSAIGASDGNLGDITINGGHVHAEVNHYTSTVIGPDASYQGSPMSIRITGGIVEAINKDSSWLSASVIGENLGKQVDGVYITGGVVSALTAAKTENVAVPPIAAANGNVLITDYASVKMARTDLQENYGYNDVPVHDMLGNEVVEYVIENPNDEVLIVNGHEFPYKGHLGEKRVYVYLPPRLAFTGPVYAVTFMLNLPDDKGEYRTVFVPEGTVMDAPTPPTDRKMQFVGWAMDPDGKKPCDLTAPVTQDMTLYGCWVKVPKTGDDFPLALCCAAMILGVGAIWLLWNKKRGMHAEK